MLALEMFRAVPRPSAGKAIGGRMPGVLSGFAAPLRLVTIDEPRIDRPGWAPLRTPLSGIRGFGLCAPWCGAVCGLCRGPDQPLRADHRRPPLAGPADGLLQRHRRRLGPAAR